MTLNKLCLPFLMLSGLLSHSADANEGPVSQQSLDDAWWTGPIIAAGAGTLPQGHALVEPYVYDVIRYGRFDDNGDKQSVRARIPMDP